jgi:hypothetical protein
MQGVEAFVDLGFSFLLEKLYTVLQQKCLWNSYQCWRCLATSLSTNSSKMAATNPALRIARRGNMLESSTDCQRGLAAGNLLGQASRFSLLIAPLRNMACKLKQSRQEGVS